MNIIYNYGLDSALMRFYSEDSDRPWKTNILSTAIWMSLLTSLILSCIIYSFSSALGKTLLSSTNYSFLIRYTAFILFFDCICHVPFALLRLEEKPFQFMGIRFINVLITFGLNIYFVAFLKMGVEGIFKSNMITSAVTATILFAFTISKIKFKFSGSAARNLALFGLPFIPAGLATVTMEMLNRYIIEHLIGLEAVGIFSAGFKLGIFMLLVCTAFYYAWQPFFLKAGKRESSRLLFSRVLTYFVLVTLSFWVLLTAFIHEIINLKFGSFHLIGTEFQACEPLVPVILLGYVFYGINQVFLPGIYFEKKTQYLAYITIIAAIANVAANFILIPFLGILGSAFSSLFGYIILASSTLIVSQRLFKVPYEFRRVILIFVLAMAIGVPSYVLQPHIIIRILIVIAFPVLLKIFGFFKKDEIKALKVLIPHKNRR